MRTQGAVGLAVDGGGGVAEGQRALLEGQGQVLELLRCGERPQHRARGRSGGSPGCASGRPRGRRSCRGSRGPTSRSTRVSPSASRRVSATARRFSMERPKLRRWSARTLVIRVLFSASRSSWSVFSTKLAVRRSIDVVSVRSDSPRPSRARESSWTSPPAASGSMLETSALAERRSSENSSGHRGATQRDVLAGLDARRAGVCVGLGRARSRCRARRWPTCGTPGRSTRPGCPCPGRSSW